MGVSRSRAARRRSGADGSHEMTRPPVELHIEELVLHGFAPGDRHEIAAAIERELARLLATGDLADGLRQRGSRAAVDAGSFSLPPGASPGAVGERVAGAVYEGLGRAEPLTQRAGGRDGR